MMFAGGSVMSEGMLGSEPSVFAVRATGKSWAD